MLKMLHKACTYVSGMVYYIGILALAHTPSGACCEIYDTEKSYG